MGTRGEQSRKNSEGRGIAFGEIFHIKVLFLLRGKVQGREGAAGMKEDEQRLEMKAKETVLKMCVVFAEVLH